SGASSSSALVTLASAAIRYANRIDFRLDKLARDSSQAEWYLGTRGGALDHTAICLAKRGRAIHISYADQSAELIGLPEDGYGWVRFFSPAADKGREVMLEYNERAAVSRLLIPALLGPALLGPALLGPALLGPALLGNDSLEGLPVAITLDDVAQR